MSEHECDRHTDALGRPRSSAQVDKVHVDHLDLLVVRGTLHQ
eukprot:COSAG03_NODE_645_length_6513_cov_2.546999_9_plen_42_part_00